MKKTTMPALDATKLQSELPNCGLYAKGPLSDERGDRLCARCFTDFARQEFPEFKRLGCMRHIARFLGFIFATGAIVFIVGLARRDFSFGNSNGPAGLYDPQDYEPPVMTRVHASDGSLIAEYARERRLYLPAPPFPRSSKRRLFQRGQEFLQPCRCRS